MITVNTADQLVFECIREYGKEVVNLAAANGRILRDNIIADRDNPPAKTVRMDGIAIRFEDWKRGTRLFHILDIQAAGGSPKKLSESSACLEVMTGAILPKGTDTVIPYEHIDINEDGGKKIVRTQQDCDWGQHVKEQGAYVKMGEILVNEGTRLTPSEIAVAASVGKAKLTVSKLPTIKIISTGDELVDVDENPRPHQIRRSNVYQLKSCLQEFSIDPELIHLKDQKDVIVDTLSKVVKNTDILILSGGVSKGKYDYLPSTFNQLGIKKVFHGVAQKPGKPFWFGYQKRGCVIFALPGNPASGFLCYHRYIRRWLRDMLGCSQQQQVYAQLSDEITFSAEKTFFKLVRLRLTESGKIEADPIKENGSGDLFSLSNGNAFLQLPAEQNYFKKGEVYPAFTFKNF